MLEPSELLAYYDYWVNGETLSRWRLLSNNPALAPPVQPVDISGPKDDAIQLTLSVACASNELCLELDASKLDPVYQILLHGSQATADTCDFSDVDVLVVLDDLRTFTAAQHRLAISELKKLLKWIYLYDNLMHHGLMFMPRGGFERYEESYLPVDTLRNARVIHGPPSIVLTRAAPRLTKQRLQSAVESLGRRLERRDHRRDDYSFKSVLSGLLLMPSLLLASIDVFRYKRESFSLGPQLFPSLDWAAIRQAEELRLRWKRSRVRIAQHVFSKISHPHTIIRLSRLYATRTNVSALLGDRSDAFTKSCQQFLRGIASL